MCRPTSSTNKSRARVYARRHIANLVYNKSHASAKQGCASDDHDPARFTTRATQAYTSANTLPTQSPQTHPTQTHDATSKELQLETIRATSAYTNANTIPTRSATRAYNTSHARVEECKHIADTRVTQAYTNATYHAANKGDCSNTRDYTTPRPLKRIRM